MQWVKERPEFTQREKDFHKIPMSDKDKGGGCETSSDGEDLIIA